MKTSVGLAVYNGQTWLKEQLDSIAAQSLQPDQIVIRDDGSTDGSMDIALAFKNEHPNLNVLLLKGNTNAGYKENFRHILKACDGDWIFLSDQDDAWMPHKMEDMIRQVKNQPQIKVLCSSFTFMDAKSRTYQTEPKPGWSNNNLYPHEVSSEQLVSVDFEELVFHNFFQGCSMMISRDIKDKVLDHWDDRIAHDWLLALFAAWEKGLYFYNKPLFCYRIHSSNTTGMIQGEKTGLLKKLSNINSYHYRTIVKKDSLNVLDVIEKQLPEAWNEKRQQEKDFFAATLKGVETGSPALIWKQKNSPLYVQSSGRFGWAADFFYALSHSSLQK